MLGPYTNAMKRRVAQLPLHTGRAPRWLFQRMTKLAGAVTAAIVEEFGPEEMLRRLTGLVSCNCGRAKAQAAVPVHGLAP